MADKLQAYVQQDGGLVNPRTLKDMGDGSYAEVIYATTVGTAGTYASLSGTIATGGTAQSLVGTSTTRNTLTITNPHATADLWVCIGGGTAAANASGSIRIGANGGILTMALVLGDPVRQAVSIVGANSAQAFTAWST